MSSEQKGALSHSETSTIAVSDAIMVGQIAAEHVDRRPFISANRASARISP
jgi:hypothetical protein